MYQCRIAVKVTMLYIVMELCTGGELFDKLYEQPGDKFSEADAHFLVKKMVGSLAYLHANKVVHRDLKLENFIFTDEGKDAEIKLIDFGFSRRYKKTDVMSNPIGTVRVFRQDYTLEDAIGHTYLRFIPLGSSLSYQCTLKIVSQH
jgi:serine/threonine protein kinase